MGIRKWDIGRQQFPSNYQRSRQPTAAKKRRRNSRTGRVRALDASATPCHPPKMLGMDCRRPFGRRRHLAFLETLICKHATPRRQNVNRPVSYSTIRTSTSASSEGRLGRGGYSKVNAVTWRRSVNGSRRSIHFSSAWLATYCQSQTQGWPWYSAIDLLRASARPPAGGAYIASSTSSGVTTTGSTCPASAIWSNRPPNS